MKKLNYVFCVYWNHEGQAGVEKQNLNDIWTSNNPDGWTYDQIGGPRDSYGKHFKTLSEAIKYIRDQGYNGLIENANCLSSKCFNSTSIEKWRPIIGIPRSEYKEYNETK